MQKISKWIVLVAVFGVLAGCRSKVSDDLKPYVHPNSDAVRQFQSLPVEKKIDIYLELVRTRKPPNYLLGHVIARSGENVVTVVLNLLRTETDDARREDLITLIVFHCNEIQDCRNYPQLDNELNTAVQAIQNRELRKDVQRQIAAMTK